MRWLQLVISTRSWGSEAIQKRTSGNSLKKVVAGQRGKFLSRILRHDWPLSSWPDEDSNVVWVDRLIKVNLWADETNRHAIPPLLCAASIWKMLEIVKLRLRFSTSISIRPPFSPTHDAPQIFLHERHLALQLPGRIVRAIQWDDYHVCTPAGRHFVWWTTLRSSNFQTRHKSHFSFMKYQKSFHNQCAISLDTT